MSRFTWSNNPISQKLREQIEEATDVKRSFTDGGRTVSEKIDSVSQKNISGRRDSNSRRQPWEGCILPLNYIRFYFYAFPLRL